MIRVNDTEIDESLVMKEMQYHSAGSQEEAKFKACESLIVSEVLQQRAKELGFGEDIDTFLDEVFEQELDAPEASEEVCQRYYDNNLHKFRSSPLVQGRHILLSAAADDAKARSEALEQGKVLIEQLQRNPEDFSELAAKFSRCPSGKTGGTLGQIGKGQTVPEFERKLFSCETGLATAPIESRYGVHVVWVDHIVPGEQLPYEAVSKKVAEYLNDRLRFKSIAHYIQNLVNQADIKGFDMPQNETPLMQ
jgi:peptidyl-prolyl cis-trans isomerase C